jgi:hypothetical protein
LSDSLEDRILGATSYWNHTNQIVRSFKGNKTSILKVLHDLVEIGYLETRRKGNRIYYIRNDRAETDEDFNYLITKIVKVNHESCLNDFKNIPKLTTKKNKITIKATNPLKYLEYLIDLNMVMIVRITYQKLLGLISEKKFKMRIKMIQNVTSNTMNEITTKYSTELKSIQEFFQNHSKNLVFKI